MDALSILNRFAEYGNYDPDQHSFNLLSKDYRIHRCYEKINAIREFDPTGAFSVMYAKSCFINICEQVKVTAADILRNPSLLDEEKEIWSMFHSEDELTVERSILDTINALVIRSADKKMLGDRDLDKERDTLLSSVESVVDELSTCQVDLFLRGSGPITGIHKFSTYIHVFETLAELLMALEGADDGLYLCYVTNHNTSDGYFGFYIKSDGNILSINERVDEAYPGQHRSGMRNGRWMDAKADSLFPYNYIFSFSDRDYLGYASKCMVDHDKLAFFNLPADAYMPLLLAMVMVASKYTGYSTSDMKLKYTDALLSVNLDTALPDGDVTALSIPATSQIAIQTKGVSIAMTTQDVLSPVFGKQFDSSSRKELSKELRETGCFPSTENIFVSLYGDGFQLDTKSLLLSNPHLKRLSSVQSVGSTDSRNAELVGTTDRFEMIAYMQGRAQLADYIRDRMFEEYKAFGGRDGVKRWYLGAIKNNKDTVLELLRQKVVAVQNGDERNVFARNLIDGSDNPLRFIAYEHSFNGFPGPGYFPRDFYPLNETEQDSGADFKAFCPVTGAGSTIFFLIRPNSWHDIELLVGKGNLPRIVTGWVKDGHSVHGNPLLDATDPVTGIGTPFESKEAQWNKRYWSRDRWHEYYFHNSEQYPDWIHREPELPVLGESPVFDFSFVVAFSKRGFKKQFGISFKEDTHE